MRPRAMLLRELISDGLYTVEERWVADALVARAAIRGSVAEPELRNDPSTGVVRALRRDARARPFRLERPVGTAPRPAL